MNIKNKEDLSKELLKGLNSPEELDNLLQELFHRGTEQLLQGEMDVHLGYNRHSPLGNNSGNSRNGYSEKTIKSEYGETKIQVPRDRNGSFTPELLPKRVSTLKGVESIIISLYAKGMSNSDIESQLHELYNISISTSFISTVTDKIKQDVIEWQNRPLESVYCIVWIDCIVIKIRENGKVVNKAVYIALGLNTSGIKEILGFWIGDNESSAYWMEVLTDLQARGVEDVLIFCCDNLKGLTKVIQNLFPNSKNQICVIHQVRNSCKVVGYKDRKALCNDMKKIYTAPNEVAARQALQELKNNWKQYPAVINSWENNWDELTVFLEYPLLIRKLIYTTNAIESVNSQIRRYTSKKRSFPSKDAADKAMYLALKEIDSKWYKPIVNWATILGQFHSLYGDRLRLRL